MANNEQVVIDEIKKQVTNVLSEQDIKDFKILQQAAKKFLNYMKNKKYLDFHAVSFSKVVQEMKQNIYHKKSGLIWQQVYDFEQAVNSFLGREIILTFVDNQGNLILVEPGKKTRQYYRNLTSLMGSDGRATFKQVGNKYQAGQDFYEKYLSTQAIAQKKQVYQKALQRFNKGAGEQSDTMRYKLLDPAAKNTFYWRTRRDAPQFLYYYKGAGLKKYNKGHIAQAYANLIISRKALFLYADLQDSLSILFNEISLDSVPAIFKGDISQGASDPVQFAIKNYNSASTAALGPYIGVAYYLVYLGDNAISKMELINKFDMIINNKQVAANSILASLMNKTTKEIEKQFNKIQKQVKLNI